MSSGNLEKYGIPESLPPKRQKDDSVPHAPVRPQILNQKERRLAVENSLSTSQRNGTRNSQQNFSRNWIVLVTYTCTDSDQTMKSAQDLSTNTSLTVGAAAIMLMIQNNSIQKSHNTPTN